MRFRPAGLHSQHPVEEQDATVRPRPQVPVRRPRNTDVVHQFLVDVRQRARQGAYAWFHRESQTHGMPRRGVGVLANDEHPNAVERAHECTQDVLAWWKTCTACGGFGAKEVAYLVDIRCDRAKCGRPTRVDQLCKRGRRVAHESGLVCRVQYGVSGAAAHYGALTIMTLNAVLSEGRPPSLSTSLFHGICSSESTQIRLSSWNSFPARPFSTCSIK